MSVFLLDDGTGTLDADLNTRASTTGGTAARVPSLGTGAAKFDGAGAIYGSANAFYYWASASPGGTDQTIIGEFDVVTLLASPNPGLGLRIDDSVITGIGKGYWVRYVSGNWQLHRFWQGQSTAAQQIGSNVAQSLSGVTKLFLRFRVSGTGTVTLVVDRSFDGITWTNIFNQTQSTNQPIDAAGKPGFTLGEAGSSTVGTHLTKLWAYDYPDTVKPAFASASVPTNGNSVAVVLTEDESAVVLPVTGVTGFVVKVGGVSKTISSATASGKTVTLNMAATILNTDTVTVEYSPGNVTDNAPSANSMDAFTAQSVTNNSTQTGGADTTPPTFASASVPSNGLTVAVVLTETGSSPVLPSTGVTGFGVTVAGSGRSISSATASGTTVTLTLASAVQMGQTVTVSYAPGNVTDSAGSPNAMASFGAQSVTNGSTVLQSIAPNHASIVRSPDNWGTINSSNAITAALGAYFIFPVVVANNEPVTLTLNTTRTNGLSAGTSPTIEVWMDGLLLDPVGDSSFYVQLSVVANSQTVTLKAAPSNGRHVFMIVYRSIPQISGTTPGYWGSGGTLPVASIDVTAIGIGGTSSMGTGGNALVAGTDYYTDTMLVFGDSRACGVLANLIGGSTVSTANAANINARKSWPFLLRDAFKCEVGIIAIGGIGYQTQVGTFQGSSPANPPMLGASGLGSGETYYGYFWNGNARTFLQTHKRALVELGGNDGSSVTQTMVSLLLSRLRTALGTTPYLHQIVDPVQELPSTAALGAIRAALASPQDTKTILIDTGQILWTYGTAHRFAPDGSHMSTDGQAMWAATVAGEVKRLEQVAVGGGGGGTGARRSSGRMGLGIG